MFVVLQDDGTKEHLQWGDIPVCNLGGKSENDADNDSWSIARVPVVGEGVFFGFPQRRFRVVDVWWGLNFDHSVPFVVLKPIPADEESAER